MTILIGKIKKINLIDLIVVAVLFVLTVILVVGLTKKPESLGKSVFVTISVTENAFDVGEEAKKEVGKVVYLNGISQKTQLVSVTEVKNETLLKIKATGELKNPIYIVLGKRIVVGEKAEVHGGFVAKGYIKEISNEN